MSIDTYDTAFLNQFLNQCIGKTSLITVYDFELGPKPTGLLIRMFLCLDFYDINKKLKIPICNFKPFSIPPSYKDGAFMGDDPSDIETIYDAVEDDSDDSWDELSDGEEDDSDGDAVMGLLGEEDEGGQNSLT